ncbi:MAG TPA: hypothetical protein VF193_17660 [Steroidobacter sp.]
MNTALPRHLAASPDLYVQKIDLVREAALVVQLGQAAYREASFLDDRILTAGVKGGWTPLDGIVQAGRHVPDPRPLHYILHTGHVGSTLVSRLLDESGCVLSLREPLPLRTLADAWDVRELPESLLSPARFVELEGALVQLWRRGYASTSVVVVKATSSACRFAPSLLSKDPHARAVYLNVAAEPYLATLLAGTNSTIDLRGHGPVRIRRLQALLGPDTPALHALSPGQLAAMSWLAETANQVETVEQFAERVLAVDFDQFLANVAEGMGRIVRQLGVPVEERYLQEIARSPVLARYSKSPDFEYSPGLRRQLLEQARRTHAEEIRRGLDWLEALGASHPRVAAILHRSQLC